MIAGTFSTYPVFVPSLAYGSDSLVVTQVRGVPVTSADSRRLWKLKTGYVPAFYGAVTVSDTGDISGAMSTMFEELFRPDEIEVGYYYVADTEYQNDPVGTSTLRIRTNPKLALISQGRVIEPDQSTTPVFQQLSLFPYAGLDVGDMTISLTKDNELVSSQTVCDRTLLSVRSSSKWTASGTGLGNAVPVFDTSRQVKVTAVNTPSSSLYEAPHGSISVASKTAFVGRVKLLFVYGVNAASVAVLNRINATSSGLLLDPSVPAFDAANAKLIDANSDVIARDQWEYNPTTKTVYLSDSVFRGDSSYALHREGYESPRNQSGAIEVKGTKKAVGTSAKALVALRSNSRIDAGASITIQFANTETGESFTSTKSAFITSASAPASTANASRQFVVGANADATVLNILKAFREDPAFVDAGFVVDYTRTGTPGAFNYVIVFTAPPGAMYNTAATITVSCPSNGLGLKQGFRGGTDHKWSFADLVGMTVRIRDVAPSPDLSCYWSVYCTGDLDTDGYDADTFYRIAYIDASMTDNSEPTIKTLSHTITADDVDGTLDTMTGIGSEFACTVAITGIDAVGSTVTETVTLDRDTFHDITDIRKYNAKRWIRTQNQFVQVTSWSVLDSSNVGNAELCIVAESGADAGSSYGVCEVTWSGNEITRCQDRRKIQPSCARPTASALAVGEAMSHACVLMDMNR